MNTKRKQAFRTSKRVKQENDKIKLRNSITVNYRKP